jgi:hypothetical protein
MAGFSVFQPLNKNKQINCPALVEIKNDISFEGLHGLFSCLPLGLLVVYALHCEFFNELI